MVHYRKRIRLHGLYALFHGVFLSVIKRDIGNGGVFRYPCVPFIPIYHRHCEERSDESTQMREEQAMACYLGCFRTLSAPCNDSISPSKLIQKHHRPALSAASDFSIRPDTPAETRRPGAGRVPQSAAVQAFALADISPA